jgi:DNA-binding HxlR family transcriptional regulator
MTPTAEGPFPAGQDGQQSTSAAYPRLTDHVPARVDPTILDLIRRPYLAEILTALDERPHTLTTLRHHTGAPRQKAIAALRALAAHHAITRHPPPATGSWDASGDRHTTYRLSPTGHALAERLLHLDVWQALFHSHPASTFDT